jgi:signal transduction histidine kinase
MSLRARLALLMALMIAVAVMAQGAVGYARYERLTLEEADRQLSDYVTDTVQSLPPALLPRGPFLHDDRTGPNDRRGPDQKSNYDPGFGRRGPDQPRLLDPNPSARARLLRDGTVIQTFGHAFPNLNPKKGLTSIDGWRIAAIDLRNNLRLEAAISLRDGQRGLRNYLDSLALTVPLFAALGALVAWLLSASALAPLETLIRAAKHVADSGDLSARVPSKNGFAKSELERLGTTFNQMLERLQGFREREVGFTRTAAHELRTPLTALRAQLDAQAQGWVTADEALESARNQTERMTKLSEALLILAREGRTEMASLDLAQLAQEVAARHGVAYIGPDSSPGSGMMRGSMVLLERALENLLENAAIHAVNSSVTVQLEHINSGLQLSVTDTGRGLSPEALERAREAFYRAPGTKSQGSGLGLAVVDRIARAHGGTFKLENNDPHGLRATLELPGLERPGLET